MRIDLSYFRNLPGLLVIKDKESIYQAMTNKAAKFLGWSSVDKSIGSTDYDMPCKAAESASNFIKTDNITLKSGKSVVIFEAYQYACGWRLLLDEKSPIKNEREEIIGVFCQVIDVTESELYRNYALLYKNDQKIVSGSSSYILNRDQCPISLTKKQECCLFWLIRGKSAKEIAKIMKLSFRTVEDHLALIKNKLNCTSKSQLIEKAIGLNYLHYIPEAIRGEICIEN